ncbi:MAG TPA: UDP-2,3-diacylglucosamine diphosphatase [Leucothrix sp.]|nr:UDP-2,3-diacylglucosamine diphosphatase [Leucothrix sp.]
MKKSTLAKQSLSTYFISDLHLHPSHPLLFKLFDDFITSIIDKAEALYILGDLFEFWIGDDIIDKPAGEPYLSVLDKLKALSDSGTSLYFIQGNRDFLAKEKFAKRIGAKLLSDEKIIDLYGTPTLIMHGDTLCTDDKNYQRMRFLLRTRLIQKIYLMQSTEKRQRIADKTRNITQNETSKKSAMILDVNQQQVEKVIKKGGVGLLIHGHTHRPAEHEFELDGNLSGNKVKRIVLSDWRDKASFLEVNQTTTKIVF